MTLTEPKFNEVESRARCLEFRKKLLHISQTVSALHIASAYSCMEMVEAAYYSLIRRDAKGKLHDTFLMSKGHGCLAQYVMLDKLGILPEGELGRYCKKDGMLGTHPDYGTPGIEASTGSLGHGLTLAVGMAYADKVRRIDRRVYTVLSDGELQEGSSWEAILLAPTLKTDNLIAFIDLNDFQSLGRTSELHPNFYPVGEKIAAFGWEVAELDGHNSKEIVERVRKRDGKLPLMIVGRTTKGKGVSFMENVPIWHYRSPNKEEYEKALGELDASFAQAGKGAA